jgi:uncharacterized protein YuzE
MKIKYDKQANALYITLSNGQIKRTIKSGENMLVDMDSKGRVVGVEFYDISKSVSPKNLQNVSVELPTA